MADSLGELQAMLNIVNFNSHKVISLFLESEQSHPESEDVLR